MNEKRKNPWPLVIAFLAGAAAAALAEELGGVFPGVRFEIDAALDL